MVSPAPKFTPERLISAPRKGPAVPNHDGTLALFTQSTHEVGQTKSLKEIRVMKLGTGESERLYEDEKPHRPVWLGDGTNTIVFLKKDDKGMTLVMMADASDPSKKAYKADEIEAPVSDLKLKVLQDGSVAFVVVGLAAEDGGLYNPETSPKLHTARVYDDYDVRFWDTYVKQEKHAIFYTTLIKKNEGWKLNKPFRNACQGTGLEAPNGMYDVVDPTDEFDVCDNGIVFTGCKPRLPYKYAQTSGLFYLPVHSFSDAAPVRPEHVTILDQPLLGYYSRPRFSPDGSLIAFQRAPRGHSRDISIYTAKLDKILLVATDVLSAAGRQPWQLKPDGFEFSSDGRFLYIDATDRGLVGLHRLDLQSDKSPEIIMCLRSVSAYHPLRQPQGRPDKLLVTSSSMAEPCVYEVIDAKKGANWGAHLIPQTSGLEDLGISKEQVSSIEFEGAEGHSIQAWVVKPRDFHATKNYPLCLSIHGGPYSSWNDSWSNRWNSILWAEQGYIVVAPNISGSKGFGEAFAAAVDDGWGGRPYDDLVKCMEYVEKNIVGIDMENAVAVGASYGGYMVNWMQGHDLGRRFKAMVCHDGVFDIPTSVLISDAIDEEATFGGPPLLWKNEAGLQRYNPARPELLKQWTTPMLVIHSDGDYRCPISDGIAAFHALKALGTPARFVNFPDENHWVLKEENSLEWHRLVFEWINRWSGRSRTRSWHEVEITL